MIVCVCVFDNDVCVFDDDVCVFDDDVCVFNPIPTVGSHTTGGMSWMARESGWPVSTLAASAPRTPSPPSPGSAKTSSLKGESLAVLPTPVAEVSEVSAPKMSKSGSNTNSNSQSLAALYR